MPGWDATTYEATENLLRVVRRGRVDDLPAVIELDPGSLVLTAFGRSDSGTIRGDTAVAERFLNLFFRT